MNVPGRRGALAVLTLALAGAALHASSHREAPGITKSPKVDGTDFYMFRSYEAGRSEFVTLIANYIPLQDVYGGPNFFTLDPDALYEIHIDNDGDAREDITFQFRFRNTYKNISLNIGGKTVAVPLINVGRIGPNVDDTDALNVIESYTLSIVRGDRRTGQRQSITNATTGEKRFIKPVDRIGDKSIRDDNNVLASVPANDTYDTYANNHIYPLSIPGCAAGGRVFVGQRREGFVVNLAETFDLINTNPVGPRDGETNDLADKNVTTLALEVPISCLVAWSVAADHRRLDHGERCQEREAREGRRRRPRRRRRRCDAAGAVHPGVAARQPARERGRHRPQGQGRVQRAASRKTTASSLTYVTNPTLPALIEALFGFAGVKAPTVPRNDLVAVFLTGVSRAERSRRTSRRARCCG